MSLDPKRLADVSADAAPDDRLLASLIEQHRQGRPGASGLRSLAKKLDAGPPVGALGRFHRLSLWGVSAVVCTALAVTAFRMSPDAPSPLPPAVADADPTARASDLTPPSSVTAAEPPATVSVHALPNEPAPAQGQAASASPAAPPSSRRATVAPSKKTCDEAELIDRAETLLRTRQAKGALEATRLHAACEETVLDQERERIAIEALVLLGRDQEATTRARAFEASYPSSPHLRRIRQLVGLGAE